MSPAADLLVIGGRVFEAYAPGRLGPYGSDIGPRPVAAPTAVAVAGDRIAWVGRDDEGLREWHGPSTTVIEARGGLITAGFDDAHIHLLGGAEAQGHVDLFQLESVEAIQAAIAAHASSDPRRRLGPRPRLDVHGVPGRPADPRPARSRWSRIGRRTWTATTATPAGSTSTALRLAGIDRDTPDPRDGEIVRDPSHWRADRRPQGGRPGHCVTDLLPRLSRDEILAATRRTIAAICTPPASPRSRTPWVEPDEVALWRALLDEGSLRLRSRLALPMRPARSLDDWRTTLGEYESLVGDLRGGAWLDAGILKGFADGVIEARTAAMLAPYVDDTSSGRPEWEPDQLNAFRRRSRPTRLAGARCTPSATPRSG